MIENINNDLKKCGIYKIIYENNKIYIGQALNIYTRANGHNNKNKYLCDKKLKQYKARIEVLEEINDISLLDERETFWIAFYDATNKEKGYNILKEGNASGKRGVENCNSVFNDEQLNNIIDLLQNSNKSYIEIAELYNVNKATIYKISNGYAYYNPNINYPIRKINNHNSLIKDKITDYFTTEKELLQLKEDLFYRWDLTIEEDLVKIYQIPLKVLRNINNGKLFKEYGNYIYPIRKKNVRNNHNLKPQDILNILNELKNTKKSMSDIGKKYNIHRDTISKINLGKSYIIKNYQYPARG